MGLNRRLTLTGSWLVHGSRDAVYAIMSDFERMPERFPQVARSVTVLERSGNHLRMRAEARSFGTVFPVLMNTELRPPTGFVSYNVNAKLGTSGEEELRMEEEHGATRIHYRYALTIEARWLRLIATPLLKGYAMRFWKKAVIDRLDAILAEQPARA